MSSIKIEGRRNSDYGPTEPYLKPDDPAGSAAITIRPARPRPTRTVATGRDMQPAPGRAPPRLLDRDNGRVPAAHIWRLCALNRPALAGRVQRAPTKPAAFPTQVTAFNYGPREPYLSGPQGRLHGALHGARGAGNGTHGASHGTHGARRRGASNSPFFPTDSQPHLGPALPGPALCATRANTLRAQPPRRGEGGGASRRTRM